MLLIAIILAVTLIPFNQAQDPLRKYVNDNKDKSYAKYTILQTTSNLTFTQYTLNVTSILWFDASFSSASIWWHMVYVTVPVNLNASQPIVFFINSGFNNGRSNGSMLDILPQLSYATQSVVVSMGQVPNQPIKFTKDPQNIYRDEDDAVAWTFREWMVNRKNYSGSTSDAIPLLFPMTKSVKRGMDQVLKFLQSKKIKTSEKFVAAGASKRGWTSLLITAIDDRIIANMPIVFDMINMVESTHQQYQKFGGAYSFALADYYAQGITLNVDSLELYSLSKLVDVASYLENFQNRTMMFILASNDEFMMPWNIQGFWRELSIQTKNKAYMRRIPNTNHYLAGAQNSLATSVLSSMYVLSMNNTNSMPVVQWDFANNITHGVIEISISNLGFFNAFQVNGYYAYTLTNQRKDFRAHVLNSTNVVTQTITWNSQKLDAQVLKPSSSQGPFKYKYAIARDSNFTRYTGFFVEIELLATNASIPQSFKITSETNIIPEFDPVGDCHNFGCLGYLV